MSRWRETLCGSVITSSSEGEAPEGLLHGEPSQILSSGGVFLLKTRMAKALRQSPTVLLHLPKDTYDVLVAENGTPVRHYADPVNPMQDFFEGLENPLSTADSKLIK